MNGPYTVSNLVGKLPMLPRGGLLRPGEHFQGASRLLRKEGSLSEGATMWSSWVGVSKCQRLPSLDWYRIELALRCDGAEVVQ